MEYLYDLKIIKPLSESGIVVDANSYLPSLSAPFAASQSVSSDIAVSPNLLCASNLPRIRLLDRRLILCEN